MKVAISFSSNINVSVENFIKMNFPQNSNSARAAFSKRNIFCLKTEEKKKRKRKSWLPGCLSLPTTTKPSRIHPPSCPPTIVASHNLITDLMELCGFASSCRFWSQASYRNTPWLACSRKDFLRICLDRNISRSALANSYSGHAARSSKQSSPS